MSTEILHREISNLERKISLLLAEHTKLKEELIFKDDQINTLQKKLDIQLKKLSDFQNKYNLSKIAENRTGKNEDSEELKKVLDGYINEIDKCIAHLSRT